MCGGGISLWREWRIANSEWRIVSGERCVAIHPFTTDHSLTYHSLFAIRYSPLNNPLPGLGDFLDAPDPLLDLAVAGLDQHVVGTGIAISGKAGAEFARVLAVPGGTQRNREWGGGLRAQASDDRRRRVGGPGARGGAVPAPALWGAGAEPCQPSHSFTARASAASEEPPTQIGIGGGLGSMRMSAICAAMYLVGKLTGSSRQSARMSAMLSSVRRPRSRNGTPRAGNSASSQPTPMPKMTRPALNSCKVAICFAIGTG